MRIPYIVERNYNPDFILPNGIICEAKGYFKSADQRKHKLIKNSPEKDIRFVFQKLVSVFKGANSLAPNGVSDTASCMQKEKSPKNGLRRKTKMAKRKDTDYIIIHCSATPRLWMWVRRRLTNGIDSAAGEKSDTTLSSSDGDIQQGRELDEIGAHCRGLNSTSVGVCLVGGVNAEGEPESNFSDKQWASLEECIKDLLLPYPMRKSQVTTNTRQKLVPHLM